MHTHPVRAHTQTHSPPYQTLLLHPDSHSPFPLPPPTRGVSISSRASWQAHESWAGALQLVSVLSPTSHVMAMPGNSDYISVCDLAAELQQPQLPLSAPIQSTVSNSPPRAGALSVKQQGVTRIILPPSLSLLPSSTDPHPQHIPLAPSGAAPAHPPQPLTKSCL